MKQFAENLRLRHMSEDTSGNDGVYTFLLAGGISGAPGPHLTILRRIRMRAP